MKKFDLFSVIGGVIVGLFLSIVSLADAETLTLALQAGSYEIIDLEDGFQRIKMEDFGNLLVPGKPILPAKVFLIALPPGAMVSSATVEGMPSELPGTYKISPAPPVAPSGEWREADRKREIQRWQENYQATYSSDEPYPESVGNYVGSGALRKYSFARVAFSPFAYHPKSGRLYLYSSVMVTIDYSLPDRKSVEGH